MNKNTQSRVFGIARNGVFLHRTVLDVSSVAAETHRSRSHLDSSLFAGHTPRSGFTMRLSRMIYMLLLFFRHGYAKHALEVPAGAAPSPQMIVRRRVP